jgi:hypothetical protein
MNQILSIHHNQFYSMDRVVLQPVWDTRHFIGRHGTLPVMTYQALVNFNVYVAFVGEQLDQISLFNHANSALLAGSVR